MVNCPTSYELYVTDDITSDWHSQPWNGKIGTTAIAPTVSQETYSPGRLVWLENVNQLMGARLDANGEIKIEMLAQLGFDDFWAPAFARALWVMDDVIVVRLNN